MIPGICSAGRALPEQLAGAAVAAALGQDRRGQVADPGDAGEGLVLRAARQGVGDALPPHLRGGDPGGVHALRLGRRAGERGRVLGRAGDLHSDHVLGALADQAGLVEDAPELVAQVRVAAAEHEGRGARHGLLGVRGAAERGDGASADPLRDVLGGQRRHRGDHPLAEQQDRGALTDAVADRADGLRKRGRGDRQADQVDAGQLDVGSPLDGQRVRELDARAGTPRSCGSRSSPRRAPGSGCRAGRRARRARAAPRRRCPSCRRRSRPPCGAVAGRRATPTAARSPARPGRRRSSRAPARGPRSAGR